MKIVRVIPISRGISKEELSYLSPSDVPAGSIVSVPLRKRTVPALVVGSEEAQALKAELKASTFAVKKIQKVHSVSLLSPAFIGAASEAADYFAATSGAVLSALIPKRILDDIRKIRPSRVREPKTAFEKIYFQTHEEERFSHYKSLIREEFAKKRSVFFLLPTIEDIRHMKPLLEKGIENYAFALHSSLTPKKVLELWNEISSTDHPVLVIGTPQFLSLNRGDIRTIIVEKESSRSYKTQTRPYLDVRVFAELLAKRLGARLVLGDRLLRTETVHIARSDETAEHPALKFRSLSSAEVSVVNMKTPEDGERRRFRVLSDDLESLIVQTKENNSHLFLFGARKGYATTTVCADCGTLVRCNNCSAPVALYSRNIEENYFYCGKCGEKRSAHERCANCTSWDLTMLGIGVERIEETIGEKFPSVKTFRLDRDSVSTEKKALDIVSRFYDTPGSVLIGTELALLYLREKVANTGVVSIDSLFAVPDFRIGEKLFGMLLAVRDLAERRSIIQTRQPDEKIFTYAVQGNLLDFYRDEIEARKMFQYPPFSIFVKVSLEGPRARVEAEMRGLQELLLPRQADLVPSFDLPGAKRFSMHALLKIKTSEWPDQELIRKLRSLPPHFRVKVDPDTLV